MVPSLSVHVAAASVKATVRCLHWVAGLAKKHHKAGTTRGTSVLVAVSSRRDWLWPLTRFASRKWRSGLNRISHPDWVKFSVELIFAPNQNTRFSSSLQYLYSHSYAASPNNEEIHPTHWWNPNGQHHFGIKSLKFFSRINKKIRKLLPERKRQTDRQRQRDGQIIFESRIRNFKDKLASLK